MSIADFGLTFRLTSICNRPLPIPGQPPTRYRVVVLTSLDQGSTVCRQPTRYRVVVLTSLDQGSTVCRQPTRYRVVVLTP